MAGFVPPLPKKEIDRLKQVLDQIDAGGSPQLLQKWINRQINRIGEDAFGRWIKAENKADLDTQTLIRFRAGLINLLPAEVRELMIELTQVEIAETLVNAGFEVGEDFTMADGLLRLTNEARDHLINETPPEKRALAEQCLGPQSDRAA